LQEVCAHERQAEDGHVQLALAQGDVRDVAGGDVRLVGHEVEGVDLAREMLCDTITVLCDVAIVPCDVVARLCGAEGETHLARDALSEAPVAAAKVTHHGVLARLEALDEDIQGVGGPLVGLVAVPEGDVV
jgi:hypothetical protein